MSIRNRTLAVVLLLFAGLQVSAQQKPDSGTEVTRSTLSNGMRVVIVRNPLAPVVTVQENYLVGGNETPDGFPGTAHAQEHMAFRGCMGISADQTAAMYAELGGNNNADTQQDITQYFATIPAADLDIALRIDAACMQRIDNSDAEWARERGAIEQEVARDLSNPTYKFLSRLNEDMFSGTPYAHDALGTHDSFEHTTGTMLKKFASDWYAPNNALLVIVGDVDPQPTLAMVKQYYGSIPRKDLPARPKIELKPPKPDSFTLDSNLPYVLNFVAFRMPGTQSPDYAAARVLSDVLSSQRGDLFALVPAGKALESDFGLAEAYPLASVAYAVTALPAEADSSAIVAEMKKIIANYASNGVPAELVDAAKRAEVAGAEFERNSIPGLADSWSEALAANGRNSPDDDVNAVRTVTVADVNRVAKQYLRADDAVIGVLKPVPSGGPVSQKGFGGSEALTSAPTKPVVFPDWAAKRLAAVEVPHPTPSPSDVKLANGLRLIVKTETASPTITVVGNIRHDHDLETPAGKDGLSTIMEQLFDYGTTTLDRLAFQKALDDIAANESAGFDFSLKVLKSDFSRGVQLLADNELNPALPAAAFDIVKKQTEEFVQGELQNPGYRAGRALIDGILPIGDPARRQVMPTTVAAVTLADLKQYQIRTVRPDLTTIVVIGDVTPNDARTVIEKWFGSWKASGAAPAVDLPAVALNKPSTARVQDPSELQDNVTMAEQVELNRFSPDYYALQLGTHVLGGGFYATRLYRDLRQVTGYVYTVDVNFSAAKTRATYDVTYACDPANSDKAEALIIRDLKDMQTQNVTPAELQQAKALLLRQIPLRESSEDDLAAGYLGRAQINLPLDEPFRSAQTYFDLTADQVRQAFQKWIRPDGFVDVIRGPKG